MRIWTTFNAFIGTIVRFPLQSGRQERYRVMSAGAPIRTFIGLTHDSTRPICNIVTLALAKSEPSTHDPRRTLLTLREKLIKIGAKVVRHGRYITFQLAKVAIPRSLFANILGLIDGLRPRPAPV